MINRGIYIIIIGIIFTGKLKVQWGCLSWFKVTFFHPIGSNFGASTERKNPFFAPLRPKGHMCLRAGYFFRAVYFGARTERKNPFFAPLRPKGHMCSCAFGGAAPVYPCPRSARGGAVFFMV